MIGFGDLFLLPSEIESFGLAALEAMASEVPVIATDVGGLPEVVTNGIDGYLIPVRDVEAGGKFALEILTRPDRGRAMGKLARTNGKARYCFTDVIRSYEAYYEKDLAGVSAG